MLKRSLKKDLVAKYAKSTDWAACKRLEDGQEFVSQDVNMPYRFCSWAWADMQQYVMVLA